jgi:hypothetical protein
VLVAVSFPIADLRSFCGPDLRLAKPLWAAPRPRRDFVRGFGGLIVRPRGGAVGWPGEHVTCEAAHAMRFVHLPPSIPCVYRRFFFDGHATGKFEVGFSVRHALRPDRTVEHVASSLLELPVTVEQGLDGLTTVPLAHAGAPLSIAYCAASSPRPLRGPQHISELVQDGEPCVFAELPRNQANRSPHVRLAHFNVGTKTIRAWTVRLSEDYSKTVVRGLRICFMRLHAEKEALTVILREILLGRLRPCRGSQSGDALQRYLLRAARMIARVHAAARALRPEIDGRAAAFEAAERGGHLEHLRDWLREAISSLDMRPNVVRTIEALLDNDEFGMTEHLGGFTMIDKSVNVQGDNLGIVASELHIRSFQNSFNRVASSDSSPDLKRVFGELQATLLEVTKRLPSAAAQQVTDDFEGLCRESASTAPRKRRIKDYIETLLQGVKGAAEFAAPATAALHAVLVAFGIS